jgi:hypothetical protein
LAFSLYVRRELGVLLIMLFGIGYGHLFHHGLGTDQADKFHMVFLR